MIPNRTILLSILLLICLIFVTVKIYRVWQEDPWEVSKMASSKPPSVVERQVKVPPRTELASTTEIIERNLFDPERGANRTKEVEVKSKAAHRIRGMTLVGTAILGDSRYAILKESFDARPVASPPGRTSTIRLKLGDDVDGFKLAEIEDKRVVFSRGASKIALSLKFFDGIQPTSRPIPIVGDGAPPMPRRERLPPPPNR